MQKNYTLIGWGVCLRARQRKRILLQLVKDIDPIIPEVDLIMRVRGGAS